MIKVDNLEEHRTALTGHCFRMLGSAAEADDAVQETMLRAWRGLARFDARSALRTWLYRISTHVCLDALSALSRQKRPRDARTGRGVGYAHQSLYASTGSFGCTRAA